MNAKRNKLREFQRRVDDILADLSASPAAPEHIARDKLVATELGSYDFSEAMTLYGSYYAVHSQLETLSKLLAGQIEAMGTAVHSASVSYDDIDLEQRERMWAVQADIKRFYHPQSQTKPSDEQASGW
ncbi:hypothetical protein ADK38_30265 [Streptomyces varsoviensis]|uniref:Uncharacterized protein n=1 Tax=Streptomyces varsoviensis TaxID=67373 RepID=A0ABR5IZK9_9ACTN|nr:hypothetical protein ADK38_30265 [Streptomyces varsoviensis]